MALVMAPECCFSAPRVVSSSEIDHVLHYECEEKGRDYHSKKWRQPRFLGVGTAETFPERYPSAESRLRHQTAHRRRCVKCR